VGKGARCAVADAWVHGDVIGAAIDGVDGMGAAIDEVCGDNMDDEGARVAYEHRWGACVQGGGGGVGWAAMAVRDSDTTRGSREREQACRRK
jgi:hypothetical protein